MARFGAISATGESIVRFLRSRFATLAESQRPGMIEQITTNSLRADSGTPRNYYTSRGSLTLLLYRVDIDLRQRSQLTYTDASGAASRPRQVNTMPLELRYLLTAWAEQPEVQHVLLGRSLSAIAAHATFAASDLVDSVGAADQIWRPDESFQLLADDMTTEDRYQIWQALGRPFEISIPLKARYVFLEAETFESPGEVQERVLGYGRRDEASA